MEKTKKHIMVNSNMFLLIFVVTILTKLIQFNFLPAKYFYDSNLILDVINHGIVLDESFNFTADFFSAINIFNFTTLIQWSSALAIIGNVLIYNIFRKQEKCSLFQYVFIMTNVVLLNIYVFNLGKDMLQFIIFSMIFFVIKSQNMKTVYKLILSILILGMESVVFRTYYLLICVMIIPIFYLLNRYYKKNGGESLKIQQLIFFVMAIVVVLLTAIYVSRVVLPEEYNKVIYVREEVNQFRKDSTDAKTIINNVLYNDGNYLTFVLNYIINAIRIMIPIELFNKGIMYLPFIAFQILMLSTLLRYTKRVNKNNIIAISVLVSYYLISFLFEPDYGSALRHESTLILLYYYIFVNEREYLLQEDVVKGD